MSSDEWGPTYKVATGCPWSRRCGRPVCATRQVTAIRGVGFLRIDSDRYYVWNLLSALMFPENAWTISLRVSPVLRVCKRFPFRKRCVFLDNVTRKSRALKQNHLNLSVLHASPLNTGLTTLHGSACVSYIHNTRSLYWKRFVWKKTIE